MRNISITVHNKYYVNFKWKITLMPIPSTNKDKNYFNTIQHFMNGVKIRAVIRLIFTIRNVNPVIINKIFIFMYLYSFNEQMNRLYCHSTPLMYALYKPKFKAEEQHLI